MNLTSEKVKFIKINRDPLFGYSKADFEELLRSTLKNRVLKAYFFGSYARNELNKFSDIDLILIADTKLPFVERFKEFLDLLDINPGIQMLIYKEQEFNSLIDGQKVGFWADVKKDLKTLI